MYWFRVRLTEEQQRVVNEERTFHPNPRIREKMLVLWLLHSGFTRQQAAQVVGVGRATVQRYVAIQRGRTVCGGGTSIAGCTDLLQLIRESFEATRLPRAGRAGIFQRTGLRAVPAAVRLSRIWYSFSGTAVRCRPKNLAEHSKTDFSRYREGARRPSGTRSRVLCGRGPFRVRHILVLPLVVCADLRPRGFRSPTVQRLGCLERSDAATDRRDQHHGRQHRDDVRTAGEAR